MSALFRSNKKRGLALRNSKGFTLLETTIATFILTAGVLGAFALIQMITAFTSGISSQLAAIYLAQEGIESVRNIRDSNWLEQRYVPETPWDQGVSSGDWEDIDKFQRQITIQKPEEDKIIISVEVKWPERGRTGQVKAETELYDWR